jgi:Beta-ketoacyl synthase, C-terminal domain
MCCGACKRHQQTPAPAHTWGCRRAGRTYILILQRDMQIGALAQNHGSAMESLPRGHMRSRLAMNQIHRPAGDPIEVGAALAVLQGGRVPLALSAAKSRVGHAEPAAGAIGMLQVRLQATAQTCRCVCAACMQRLGAQALLHANKMNAIAALQVGVINCPSFATQAAAMLGQATGRALMHLRSVNAHVSSLLSSKTQVLVWCRCRTCCCMPLSYATAGTAAQCLCLCNT